MKKDTCLGAAECGGVLFWARAARSRPQSAAATGENAPPSAGAEGLSLVLPLKDSFCKILRIPSADSSEIALIARNMMEADAPLDPSEMVFSHETLETAPGGADGDGGSALVIAVSAPVSAVDALRSAAGCDAGRIDRVDVFPLALATALSKRDASLLEGRRPALADFDGRIALIVFDAGRPVVARDLGSTVSAAAPSLTLALRLALVQAERDNGSAEPSPLLVLTSALPFQTAATTAAKALGLKTQIVPEPRPEEIAFSAASRSLSADGRLCNLFPDSWQSMLSDRKFKRSFATGIAGAFAIWLALACTLFGWPALLSMRETALQNEVDRLAPEESAVDQFRNRIKIIERYSDRTWSPLEVLREVAIALPQGVTLTMFRQDAGKREALVEASARASAPAYDFSNRLKESPLFERNDIVAGPTENRNTGRTSFQLRLTFTPKDGDGGAAR